MKSRVTALLLGLALPAFASDPSAPFRESRLDGTVRDAAGLAFTIGTASYALSSGTLAGIAASDGAPAGFFFQGKGTLTWRVEDPAAAKVFGDNARRLGGFEVGKDGTLTAPFTRASFWLSAAARPAVEGFTPGAPPAAAFAKHRLRFARDQMTPPEIGLAAARADGGLFAAALLEGKRDLRHEVDALFSGEERIAVVAEMEAAPAGFVDWRLARDVGSVPVGRGPHDPPESAVTLKDLSVDVREGNEGRGDLDVRETYVARRPARVLALQLASETLGRRGLSSLPTTLSSVALEDGRPLPFALEKDALLVLLPAPLAEGESVSLRFVYSAGFFEPRVGSSAWELGLAQGWYPAPRPFRSACRFTYHAVVRTRSPLLAFTSGETVRRETDGAWELLEARQMHPVAMVGVLAGPYTVLSETHGGVVCRIASYTLPKAKASARLFELFDAFRAFYEPLLGPFPWKEVVIAERSRFGSGQATPGLVLATREAFALRPRRERKGAILPEGIDRHLAHELAHAWFGYGTWGASEKDAWLDEAFAEWYAARAIETLGDREEFRGVANVWRLRSGEARKEAPIWLATAMSDKASLQPVHDSGPDRYALLYFKGAVLLEALRKEIGDEKLSGAIRAFLETHPGAATTDDLVATLSERTGRDWRPWFARTAFGFEMP